MKSDISNEIQHVLGSFQKATLHLTGTGTHGAGFSAESTRKDPKGQATLVDMADCQGKLQKEP